MTARNILNLQSEAKWQAAIQSEAFDIKAYLLARYGCRMAKKDVSFECKKSRATIDNMRNSRHPSYDPLLADAEVKAGLARSGKIVLFDTLKIAKILSGEVAGITDSQH